MFDAGSASDSALQRGHGQVRLRFGPAALGATRVVERYAAAPARLLVPRVYGAPPEVVLANTAGGVAGGDRLDVVVTADAHADATVTGQAAEKIYRAIDAPARIHTRLDVGAGATLEWLPQETILFDGARLERRIDVALAADARLLLAESVVFGRRAHGGELFRTGLFDDRWRIDRDGRPLWRDALYVAGGGAALGAAAGLAGARALATLVYAGPDGPALLEPLRDLIERTGLFAGATATRGLLIARMLGDEAGALKRALAEVVGGFRALALGRPATAPRVWLC